MIGFLSGDTRTIVRELEAKMRDAAAGERFEEAARYRNRLFAIESLAARQAADKRAVGTVDVIGIAADGDRAVVQVFPLRDGKLIDRYSFHLENVEGHDRATILESFCLEYYTAAPTVPPQVIVPADIAETDALEGFLGRAPRRSRRGARPRCGARSAAWPGSRTRTRASRSSTRRRPASRSGCGASRRSRACGSPSTSRACPCASSASTSRTSRGATSSPR